MSSKKHRIVADIDQEDNDNLKLLAMALGGISKSEIIRIAIRYHLSRNAEIIKKQKMTLKEIKKMEK